MMRHRLNLQRLNLLTLLLLLVSPAAAWAQPGSKVAASLPKPFATESVAKAPKVLGWPAGKTPTAPEGFEVTAFAAGIDNPRWIYVLPNGDVLIAQSRTVPKPPKPVVNPSPNKITLLRDADGNGQPEVSETLLADLNQPLGMVLVSDRLLVACTDGVLSFPFKVGQTKIDAAPMKIMDLPAGGYNNHWTRNVIANHTGTKIYISVGSASDVAEHGTAEEMLRANILEANPDGTGLCVFASGIRNPVGMDWNAASGKLWTAVNERDKMGDELVPDYLTSVERGGFYGWPFAYFGPHEDPRHAGQRPDLVAKTIVPDLSLDSHTASLGLAFYNADSFPERYRGGAFVGQRGSSNRSQFVGYRVAFVPFQGENPTGEVEDFLGGFIASDTEVYGRPVGVAVAGDGSLLVADEPGNTIWRVSVKK